MDYPEDPCPFCTIASAFKPISPLAPSASSTICTPSTTTNAAGQAVVPIVTHQEDSARSSSQQEDQQNDPWDPEQTDPPSFVILSTPDVIAFFDIAPLTRGHILVAPRNHRKKVGDLGVLEGGEVSQFSLPCLHYSSFHYSGFPFLRFWVRREWSESASNQSYADIHCFHVTAAR